MKEGDLVVCVDDSPWGTVSGTNEGKKELQKGKAYVITDEGDGDEGTIRVEGYSFYWRNTRFIKIEV